MFVKFIRKDGTPIWIKAASIVTVEPAHTGGSILVPMGDGLDYEVVETPEMALAMIAGEPLPKSASSVEAKKTKRSTRKTKASTEAVQEEPASAEKDEKAKKATRTRKKVVTEEPESEPESEPEPVPIFFAADQIDRLRKMAPGSVKKLANTLVKQFKVEDPDVVVKHLEVTGVIAVVEHGHVKWLSSSEQVLIPGQEN